MTTAFINMKTASYIAQESFYTSHSVIAAFINMKTLFYIVQTSFTCRSLHLIFEKNIYIAQKSFYTSCKVGKLSRIKPVAGPHLL